MTKRKSISKKLRFSIFERDDFTCQYCGKNPENHDIALEVDHVISVFDGGDNSKDNLATSCFDCNRGKSKKSIIKKAKTSKDVKFEIKKAQERLSQIKMIIDFKIKKKNNENSIWEKQCEYIFEVTGRYNDDLNNRVKKAIRARVREGDSFDLLIECLEITEAKFSDTEFYITDFIKYFYGVLRKRNN